MPCFVKLINALKGEPDKKILRATQQTRLAGFDFSIIPALVHENRLSTFVKHLLILFLLFCSLGHSAQAGEHAEILNFTIETVEEAFEVRAEIQLDLNPRLEEAVQRGLPLFFNAELSIAKPRWYWFDENLVTASKQWRLSYAALTRQYRLSTGSLALNFTSLNDAISVMTRLRGWRVADRNLLKTGQNYDVQLRFRLDISQLPKPFQISAFNSRDWNVNTDWAQLSYTVPAILAPVSNMAPALANIANAHTHSADSSAVSSEP